ncbi:MAG: ElyC/SanA/YdcF family protein [Desulfomonilaceae bacterium]
MIYPVGLTLTIMVVGLIMFWKRSKFTGILLFSVSFLTLLTFSLNWTGMVLLKQLEDRAGSYADPAELEAAGVRIIIVLGGTSFTNEESASDVWDRSVLRLLEGIRLWKGIPGAKLALSGGAPSSPEAMAVLPMRLGIPKEFLLLETRALDTDDEANLFQPVVKNMPFALVTSASHMPRALNLFRSKGMNPMPCPCDFRAKKRQPLFVLLAPDSDGIYNSQLALHEYYGQLFFFIKELWNTNRCEQKRLSGFYNNPEDAKSF